MKAALVTTTNEKRIELLADLIIAELQDAGSGHCARVNYLSVEEAGAVCQFIRSQRSETLDELHVYLLKSREHADDDAFSITADRAIELRNRKIGSLCLFVHSGLIDATASSIGNSFAEIDGRRLHRDALNEVRGTFDSEARQRFQAVNTELTGTSWASDDEKLDFALVVADLEATEELNVLGLELWRIGLISDGRPDFTSYLRDNRNCVRKLARPRRLSAPYRDRIQQIGVTEETASRLEEFFANRTMHDVREWSAELHKAGLTLDKWTFAEDRSESDLESVQIDPFTKPDGAVVPRTKLQQQDGPGGALYAIVGDRNKMSVYWTTSPAKPLEGDSWLVEMVPVGLEVENDELNLLDLPSRQVKGKHRRADIKLDFTSEDLPQTGFQIRVTAVDASGNEIRNQRNEPITTLSDEFYLKSRADEPDIAAGSRRKTVSTLALGRLEAAIEAKTNSLEFDSPSWVSSGDSQYFSIKAHPRTILNIELSVHLRELQSRTLGRPGSGGQWHLNVDETAAISSVTGVQEIELVSGQSEEWAAFWRARKVMFERISRHETRYVIEAMEWSTDQLNGAINYAQSYTALLAALSNDDLRSALSIDTLHVQVDRKGADEHAVVVMPTHPLRLAWFAIHASLLSAWEKTLIELDRNRSKAIDLDLVRELLPLNMPPFVYGAHAADPYVFFQNLNAYHGVALPADTLDPIRRMHDLATILGVSSPELFDVDPRPQYLGRQLQRYRDGHSYADPLVLALVNSDRGDFLARAIQEMLRDELKVDEDADQIVELPALDITAYVPGDRISRLSDMESIRTQLANRSTRTQADALRPALSTSVKSYQSIGDSRVNPAHVAMVTDLSRPNVVPIVQQELEEGITAASLSMYGLVARFVGTFEATTDGFAWEYLIAPWGTARSDPHPSGPRFGKVLPEAMASMLRAIGRCMTLEESEGVLPAVRVAVDQSTSQFLERLHRSSDWVITIDRFFGVEYFDSPTESALDLLDQKHLIDYSPEFSDGLSHRTIVTTVWRDEINVLLRRAVTELGFTAVDQSVRTLLHYLKLVSGRLALQAASPTTSGTAAMSLSAVIAWLQSHGRLKHSIVIPVDHHQGLFRANSRGVIQQGQRRCDLMLVGFRRGIVDATFIEVKWRRGATGSLEGDAGEMKVQMEMTARGFEDRFFNLDRVDGALQRANLANTLRFYGRRSLRHGMVSPEAWSSMVSHIEQLERTNVDVRIEHEGFIVNLDRPKTNPIVDGNVTIRVLTAQDFEEVSPGLVPNETVTSSDDPVRPDGRDGTTGNPTSRETDANRPKSELGLRHEQNHSEELETAPDDKTECQTLQVPCSSVSIDVMLGSSVSGPVVWSPSVAGSPHLFITGIPGQGKSWTIMNIMNRLATASVPALVFDFHGQFGEQGKGYAEKAKPRVINAAEGLPFSPFESNESSMRTNWRATAHGVAAIFGYVCKLGEIQQDVLYQCIRDAYMTHGFGDDTADITGYPSLQDVQNRIERMERRARTHNLTARLRPLFEMDIFHHDLEDQPNLIETIRGGLVIDLHELHSETIQLMAGAFVLRKLYLDMFQWGVAENIRLVIILDEAHRLARDVTLPKLMKEGRKFGIAVVVASQGLEDFHPDIVNNAGTKIAFRANHNESRKIAGFFRSRTGQPPFETLEGLHVGQALVQTPSMGIAARAQMAAPDAE